MRPPSAELPVLHETIGDPEIAGLFEVSFLESTEVFDELVNAACRSLLVTTGAWPGPAGVDPEDAFRRLGLAPASKTAFLYLFDKLVDAGTLVRRDGRTMDTGRSPGDVARLAEELTRDYPAASVGGEVVRLLADEGGAFFSGRKTGEDILFAPSRLPLWFRYFSNENILYKINNSLGATALSRALAGRRNATVLEVGGGCGSAAELAIPALAGTLARYRFSEIVPTFLRRGERAARAAAGSDVSVETLKLDMTKSWSDQGVPPGSVDAVYSVNCFHVAPDLDFVLREARTALKPGGAVVVSECLRPTALARPIHVEFVFDFLESFTAVGVDPVRRPTHGFLTPVAWRASFEAAGFPDVAILPEVDRIARRFPGFFIGAVVARTQAEAP